MLNCVMPVLDFLDIGDYSFAIMPRYTNPLFVISIDPIWVGGVSNLIPPGFRLFVKRVHSFETFSRYVYYFSRLMLLAVITANY